MTALPSGTVTFLFTDIEGSTALWERDRAAMREAVDRQLAILHSLISAHHGVLFKTIGDGTQAAFGTAEEALRAALASQRALLAEDWSELGPLRVRMALHAGEAIPDDKGDYLAAPLNRLARLLSTGYGGQILLSQTVQQLTRGVLPAGSELRDLGEHRLRDLLEPERVYQLLHPDLPADFPPLKSLEHRPNNLPRQPTPFLGREREVGEVVGLLQKEDVQLVTLVGPGGTGKTRLGLQVAAELSEEFADGVFFVPLAALTDPALVPSSIADAVGVREAGETPVRALLRDELCQKQVLLLLDNFEQVTSGVSVVTELLSACARLKVLVTSRVPLRLRAEQEYPVPPLPLPRRKPPPTAEQLSQYEAVRLFIERARAVRPDFAIDNATAPVVAEICHRLDGLPLAIELAAARVKLLPLPALLDRLGHRLKVLTGGARDLPARQRTLRDAIAWSHDLLSPEEQALFRRLSVFAGGCTFEAAEAVANPDGELDLFEGLGTLVDNSLLRQEEGLQGEPRVSLLETIREYAAERLEASGEDEATRRRHATYFLDLAEEAEPELTGPRQAAWLNRLEAEHDNVRAALTWALQHDAEAALRMTAALWRFWWIRGHLSEGYDWLERALGCDRAVAPAVRIRALYGAGALADLRRDDTVAVQWHEAGLALARDLGDDQGAMMALFGLGTQALARDDLERARVLTSEALTQARALGEGFWIGIIASNLGIIAARLGDLERSTDLLEENLALARQRGDQVSVAISLGNLADVLRARGDRQRAVTCYRVSLALSVELEFIELVAQVLAGIGVMAADEGQVAQAARLFGAATSLAATIGAPIDPVLPDALEAAITTVCAVLGEEAFAAAWEAGRALSLEDAVAEALSLIDAAAPVGKRHDEHPLPRVRRDESVPSPEG
jgi:predicted ATPase/class 3 adenylate cyclase